MQKGAVKPVHVSAAAEPAAADDAAPSPRTASPRTPGAHGTALPRLLDAVARNEDLLLKLIAVAATPFVVLVFLAKYLPDFAFLSPEVPRLLTDYDVFMNEISRVGTFRPRFAAFYLHYYVGKAIEAVIGIREDVRLHPLRLAAAVITTVSLWLVAAPALLDRTRRWDWRVFYAGLLSMMALSLYLYLPFDFPSLVFISFGMIALLQKRKVLAMVLLLACGIVRENNIHIAWFAVSMLLVPSLSVGLGWAAAYVVAFFAEWWVMRWVLFRYEGNDIRSVIYKNLISLTAHTIVTIILAIAAIGFVVVGARMARARRRDPLDTFFMIQILMVPVWLVFYLVNGSNWTEFRIQLGTLLPVLYALSYRPAADGPGDDVEHAAAPSAV